MHNIKNKIIHFICTENMYRSRMAEAYFNNLNIPGIKAISSGIHASRVDNGPVSWYSMRIIYNNKLISTMSRDHRNTTIDLLKQSDFVVFMEDLHLNYCRDVLGYTPKFYQIWNISDVTPQTMSDKDIIETSEKTFIRIKEKTSELINVLRES